MYNVKGPSKIVAKTTRRGLPQNIESLRDYTKNKGVECENSELNNGPKPIFQNVASKRSNHQRNQEYISPQHEEIIKYINESWNSVCSELKHNDSSYPKEKQAALYYKDDPCPLLQNFKPFDLEAWWGKRLLTCITNSVNSKN